MKKKAADQITLIEIRTTGGKEGDVVDSTSSLDLIDGAIGLLWAHLWDQSRRVEFTFLYSRCVYSLHASSGLKERCRRPPVGSARQPSW
jgi:hypothetical protein